MTGSALLEGLQDGLKGGQRIGVHLLLGLLQLGSAHGELGVQGLQLLLSFGQLQLAIVEMGIAGLVVLLLKQLSAVKQIFVFLHARLELFLRLLLPLLQFPRSILNRLAEFVLKVIGINTLMFDLPH